MIDAMPGEAPQNTPKNLEAVIAIQGGGIYALPMLGQVRAILSAGYVPLGFAGNSGGAILATLLWSGLTPDRIEGAFREALEADPLALTNLLLPEDGTGLTLKALRDLIHNAEKLFPLPSTILAWPWYLVKNIANFWRLRLPMRAAWHARGLFSGERLTSFVDGLVREGLGIDSGRGSLLTFGQARNTRRRPPLLLTATNVSTGRLELIDSTDARYEQVAVADAVRASAGFPVFFRPVDLKGAAGGLCFVDGGMISNFPLWAFSRAFREKLQQSSDYGWLAPRPWIPIGVRVGDEANFLAGTETRDFVGRLVGIATGMARDDLEDRLVGATLSHALIIRQETKTLPLNPETGRPLGFLDVGEVTKENLRLIVDSGVMAAEAAIRRGIKFTIYDDKCGAEVVAALDDLITRCEQAMSPAPADILRFRANIFIAERQTLRLSFSARMGGTIDSGLAFRDLTTGVTGWVYQTRSPAICNLDTVGKVVGTSSMRPFNFDADLQKRIDPDTSWLVSYPIFDPRERQALGAAPAQSDMKTVGLHRLQAEHVGPILGILNVDAGWDYEQIGLDASPDLHSCDVRILAVVDIVAQASLRLAHLLIPKNERLVDVE